MPPAPNNIIAQQNLAFLPPALRTDSEVRLVLSQTASQDPWTGTTYRSMFIDRMRTDGPLLSSLGSTALRFCELIVVSLGAIRVGHGESRQRIVEGIALSHISSCPSSIPLTLIGRLDAAEQRLEATIKATRMVLSPLERFYEALGDEQRGRLGTAVGQDDCIDAIGRNPAERHASCKSALDHPGFCLAPLPPPSPDAG